MIFSYHINNIKVSDHHTRMPRPDFCSSSLISVSFILVICWISLAIRLYSADGCIPKPGPTVSFFDNHLMPLAISLALFTSLIIPFWVIFILVTVSRGSFTFANPDMTRKILTTVFCVSFIILIDMTVQVITSYQCY